MPSAVPLCITDHRPCVNIGVYLFCQFWCLFILSILVFIYSVNIGVYFIFCCMPHLPPFADEELYRRVRMERQWSISFRLTPTSTTFLVSPFLRLVNSTYFAQSCLLRDHLNLLPRTDTNTIASNDIGSNFFFFSRRFEYRCLRRCVHGYPFG